MNSELKEIIESTLGEKINSEITVNNVLQTTSGKKYFLKAGLKSPTYKCEASGLKELKKAQCIETVNVVSVEENYILTEYIDQKPPSTDFFERFGKNLAKIHQYRSDQYGFYEDNFIGTNIQLNIPDENEKTDWISFYFNKRLLFQYKLAEKNGHITKTLQKGFIKLESIIHLLLKDSLESPCILHGDLWAGNFLCNQNNNPVFIDPAVYYGHREAELAMTRLFGGFPPSFYESYNEEYPLKPDWKEREGIYRLYHVLNHLNMFGYTYLSKAEQLIAYYKNY